jgi:hypothetical protein
MRCSGIGHRKRRAEGQGWSLGISAFRGQMDHGRSKGNRSGGGCTAWLKRRDGAAITIIPLRVPWISSKTSFGDCGQGSLRRWWGLKAG